MMRALALLAAVLLSACSGAGNDGAAQPELWRLTDYGDASQCTPERAVRVKISDITTNIARYHRTCVTVEGLAVDGWLYQDYETIYRNFEEIKLPELESGTRQSIDAEVIQFFSMDVQVEFPKVHTAIITGYPVSCDIQHAELDAEVGVEDAVALAATGKPRDVVVWLSGPCHAPFFDQHIRVTHLVLPPRVPVWRLLPPAARNEDGNLRPAPPGWPHTTRFLAAAHDFLAAVRGGDRAKLCNLLYPESEASCREEPEQTDVNAVRSRSWLHNTFSELASKQARPEVILVEHSARLGEPPPAGDWVEVVFCVCALNDCSRLWPVDWSDTGLGSSRPFACVLIEFDPRTDGETYYTVKATDLGLDEPPWSPAR